MLKRILISLIIIMITSATLVYGTDEVTLEPSQDNITNSEENSPGDIEETPISTPELTPEPTPTPEPTQETEPEPTPPTSTPEPIIESTPAIETTPEPIVTPEETPYVPNTPVNVVTKSSEATLKELKIDVEGLTPEFNKNTTEYYLIVDLSVENIQVTAIPTDNKAKVNIKGNRKLDEGENTITITVTAEDETTKNYYIYVTRIDNVELANAELATLEIPGFSIYPSFKSNIFSYNLNINESINSIDITAIPQREKATVVVEGNNNLHEGENLIKLTVTAEDGTTIRTYKINTYIDSSAKVVIEEENKIPALILIVVLSVIIIVLGTFIVIKKRK